MRSLTQIASWIGRRTWLSFVVVSVVYLALIIVLPADKAALRSYGLTPFEYHITGFAVGLATLVVWFIAFFGYVQLHNYARAIRKSAEGQDFMLLARGGAWLAWSLPVIAITLLLLNGIANWWADFRPAATILGNYSNLLFPLIAFSIIGSASRGLLNKADLRISLTGVRTIMALFVGGGVFFCYLTFRHFDLTGLQSTDNPYHMPIWLVVTTLIIPYLYAWFVGLLAAYEIMLVSKHIRGLLYRQALRLLVGGLVAVIASSIALQYMSGIEPTSHYIALDYKLVLALVFRAIGGVGFLLIALGSMRLKKIEEV